MLWALALAPLVLALSITGAWAIDNGASTGTVVRNVVLEGSGIGGMGRTELTEHLDGLEASLIGRTVRIETPTIAYETTAAEIGLSIDVARTVESALRHGRTAVLPLRPVGWLMGFLREREAHLHYEVDVEAARAELRRLEGDALLSPVEPTIVSTEGSPFVARPGVAGTGIDPQRLATELAEAASSTPLDAPVSVEIEQSALSPRLDDRVAETAAVLANARTGRPLVLWAGEVEVSPTPGELRSLIVGREAEDGIELQFDPERTLSWLASVLAEAERDPVDARFTIDGGSVVLIPAQPGLACCDEAALEAVQLGFDTGQPRIEVPLTDVEPFFTTAAAEAMGIVAEVGQPDAFGPTTRYQCCQSRVTNIHRIADLVRGVVIPPGGTFSVNDHVGRRTVEKGFVSGGVIYDGEVSSDIGGGVSQFATTLFNAALYAGLEFSEYQSHSLYFSRYPRGHEATISWPAPDLQIENPTPYGVLIWPTYTDTSITVRLYSTPHIWVEVGEPVPSPAGNCTRWSTPRSRTFPSGEVVRDQVHARYRPDEGVEC